ncbi:MAG: ATP dependent DNA ligase [Acidobacteriota bacterium]
MSARDLDGRAKSFEANSETTLSPKPSACLACASTGCPESVVQVGFNQWTKYNKLRHPRLIGVRMDKEPR